MEKYRLTSDGIYDNETLTYIPQGHRKYKLFLDWVDAGNIPDPEFTQEELDEQVQFEVDAANEVKIQNEIRRFAIVTLKGSGDLPPDFEDTKDKVKVK